MNRRTLIKSLAAVVTLGGAGTAVYNFLTPGEGIPLADLPKNKALVAELVETIIPRTTTPGAKDAGVENFIIKIITENTDVKMQQSFLAGLKSVDAYAENKYGKSFVKCSPTNKNAIMKHFEDKATYSIGILNKVQRKFLGAPFFYQLRDLTVEGYCTSQIGATQGMAYDYVPVTFEACVPLQPNQLSWATK
ncbi:gluconate 2-dehydrogenase subunit 3 family protein [Mucilaginibacter auburnensis]|uniref:Gluconate 2-dehydrogenase subunit 3-like protein n=1 Tax=Mucilaginibacter auburnensis TaxID=1457233 RepID=A0A2H9VLC3_9SPHI|nr:gluconate 2-dehydrogenase subunit 3 family protein [Mucilaginibacter auburnensis]PJJ79075.1 gluconate 2-dehydrogenase subunit 3-like protein [Mucilaginibacter auburnensis]